MIVWFYVSFKKMSTLLINIHRQNQILLKMQSFLIKRDINSAEQPQTQLLIEGHMIFDLIIQV